MTLRSMTRRTFAWAAMALALACVMPVAAQGLVEAPTLESVLAGFARVEALSAHFKEEKRMALLTVPLVSEGDLYYQKPRSLARHTRSPSASSLASPVRFSSGATSTRSRSTGAADDGSREMRNAMPTMAMIDAVAIRALPCPIAPDHRWRVVPELTALTPVAAGSVPAFTSPSVDALGGASVPTDARCSSPTLTAGYPREVGEESRGPRRS